jgi:hypothetical protein
MRFEAQTDDPMARGEQPTGLDERAAEFRGN